MLSGLGSEDARGSPAPPGTAAPTHRVQCGQPVRRVEWGPRRPLPSWALPLTIASPSRPRWARSQAAGWDPLSHPPGTPTPPQTCCGVRPSGMGPSSGAGGLMSETLTSRSPMSSSSESPGKGGGLVTRAGREGRTCSDSRSRSRAPCRPASWEEQLLGAARRVMALLTSPGGCPPGQRAEGRWSEGGEGPRGSALRTHPAESLSLLRAAHLCLPKARPPMSPSPGTKNSFLLDAEKREECKP